MTELESLVQKRSQLGAQMVVLMFEIVLILLIPVATVLYGANIINSIFHTGKLLAFPLTVSALALSWVSIWKIYSKVDKEMIQLDNQIRDIKIREGYDPGINRKKQEVFDKAE